MKAELTAIERERLDYLAATKQSAYEAQKSLMNDFSLSGRHWYFQLRDEIVRLSVEESELWKAINRRERESHLERSLLA